MHDSPHDYPHIAQPGDPQLLGMTDEHGTPEQRLATLAHFHHETVERHRQDSEDAQRYRMLTALRDTILKAQRDQEMGRDLLSVGASIGKEVQVEESIETAYVTEQAAWVRIYELLGFPQVPGMRFHVEGAPR